MLWEFIYKVFEYSQDFTPPTPKIGPMRVMLGVKTPNLASEIV